jgi:hypothetical protein
LTDPVPPRITHGDINLSSQSELWRLPLSGGRRRMRFGDLVLGHVRAQDITLTFESGMGAR